MMCALSMMDGQKRPSCAPYSNIMYLCETLLLTSVSRTTGESAGVYDSLPVLIHLFTLVIDTFSVAAVVMFRSVLVLILLHCQCIKPVQVVLLKTQNPSTKNN